MNIYSACPACSNVGFNLVEIFQEEIKICTTCGGMYGTISTGIMKALVKPFPAQGDDEADQYFDFIISDKGNQRYHGWVNKSGQCVQVG